MSVTFDARFFDEYHVFNCTVVQAGILLKVGSLNVQRLCCILTQPYLADVTPWPPGQCVLSLRASSSLCTVARTSAWCLQHVLSTFRTQRVNKIVFELKAVNSRATVTLYCDNGMSKPPGQQS